MVCESYQVRFGEWLEGDLTSDLAREFESHAASCANCTRAWSEFRQCQQLISTLAAAEPPRDLMQRIHQRIATAGQLRVQPCSKLQPLLPAYAEGELGPEASESVLAHLLVCQPCHKELRQLELQMQLLRSVPPITAPADLKAKILTAVDAHEQSIQKEPRASRRWTRPAWQWTWGLPAAACAVAMLAFMIRGTFRNQPGQSPHPGVIARQYSGDSGKTVSPTFRADKKQHAMPVGDTSGEKFLAQMTRTRWAAMHRATAQPERLPSTAAGTKKRQNSPKVLRKRSAGGTHSAVGSETKTDNTMIANAESTRTNGSAATEDRWLTDRPDEFNSIPQTPLEVSKPTPTVKSTEPEPKPAPVISPPKRLLVLETAATNRRPLDDIRVRLSASRRSNQEYRITEDRIPSKMLSVNVITMTFK